MATLYVTEPATQGKVILNTTAGDLDIELWPKEAPKAVRNFVQLCLEGYYDGCTFHRMLPDFLIQTGDPTGTGQGGESAYGAPFKDEFHSRLKFSRRGLVACANENTPHSNGSQFFLTLGKAEGLDRKHTIFGSITGESIYNLAALNDLEVGEDDRPLHAPRITGSEVLWNPFEDIVPRTTREERMAEAAEARAAEAAASRAEKRKLGRQAGLLSFEEEGGEEAAEEGADAQPAKRPRMRSAHDAAADPRLAQGGGDADTEAFRAAARAAAALKRQAAANAVKSQVQNGAGDAGEAAEEAAGADAFAERMRFAAQAKAQAHGDQPRTQERPAEAAGSEGDASEDDEDEDDEESQEDEFEARHRRVMAETAARPAAVKPSSQQIAKEDLELLSGYEQRMAKAKQQTRLTKASAADMKLHIQAFRKRLRGAPQAGEATSSAALAATDGGAAGPVAGQEEAYAGKVRADLDHNALKPAVWRVDNYLDGEDEADLGISALVGQRLVFAKNPAVKDEMARTEQVDDYLVEDARDARAAAGGAPKSGANEWRAGRGPGGSQGPSRPSRDERGTDRPRVAERPHKREDDRKGHTGSDRRKHRHDDHARDRGRDGRREREHRGHADERQRRDR